MDDIVQARKARMKLWNTSSEKVCEVQTVNEAGASTTPLRYTNRRYSDFVGSTLTPIPAASTRRASENPVIATTPSTSAAATTSKSQTSNSFFKRTGIVVTNSDLKSLITSLASSATEINKVDDTSPGKSRPSTSSNTLAPEPSGITRSNRSNSFDVSILHNAKQMVTGNTGDKNNTASLSGWFEKRHQPMSRKKSLRNTANVTVSFSKEVLDRFKDKDDRTKEKKPKSRLRWDNKSAFVDPHIIGNAIEGFLRKSTRSARDTSRYKRGSASTSSSSAKSSSSSSSFWFGKGDEDDSKDTCDSSLCSTLKDLFVK